MIVSPITNSINIRLKDKIDVQTIIDLYKQDFHMDVSKYFQGKEDLIIYECLDSGFLFYSPNDLAGDEGFYDELKVQVPLIYNGPYYPEEKWEYDVCIDYINPGDKVYEIGAGNGAFLTKLINKKVSDVSGSELNYNSVEYGKNKGINIEYLTIEEKAEIFENQYDVVCGFQVLEHITTVKPFLDAAIKILKPGGKLIFAVPYNNPYFFGNDKLHTLNLPPHHMGLWNKDVFEKLPLFYPLISEKIIIEPLPKSGYDFDRYFKINKDKFLTSVPFRNLIDKIYYIFLRIFHSHKSGRNIIAIYHKK